VISSRWCKSRRAPGRGRSRRADPVRGRNAVRLGATQRVSASEKEGKVEENLRRRGGFRIRGGKTRLHPKKKLLLGGREISRENGGSRKPEDASCWGSNEGGAKVAISGKSRRFCYIKRGGRQSCGQGRGKKDSRRKGKGKTRERLSEACHLGREREKHLRHGGMRAPQQGERVLFPQESARIQKKKGEKIRSEKNGRHHHHD